MSAQMRIELPNRESAQVDLQSLES